MLSLVKTQKGIGFVELMQMPEPVPGPHEVVIEVKACGICGTDVHILHDEFPYWPPVILGHEFSGRIAEIGPGVDRFRVGERVVAEPHTESCGYCYLCRSGDIHVCPMKRAPGWGIHGAFAKYVRMPDRLLHRIPDHLCYEDAAVVEPAANAVHDVLQRARMTAGDFVVVLGPGPIGLLSALAARAGGARHVIVVGMPTDEAVRLAKAKELGFETVNVAEKDPVEVVRDLTGGIGADMAVEASGSAGGVGLTPHLIRRKGRICVIGLPSEDPIPISWRTAAFKDCEVTFCLSTHYSSWDRTINLIASGLMPAGRVVTHRLPLTEWRHAFEELEALRAIKVLLVPDSD
jgi:threonine dehydrogenase-like Zn-dependent dehydrogenase